MYYYKKNFKLQPFSKHGVFYYINLVCKFILWPSYVLSYESNQEYNKKTKSTRKNRIKRRKCPKTIKIESLDNWTLLKPTILKYGNCKYHRTAVRKNQNYFFCAARKSKGCKASIVLKDGKPFRISCFAHNH